MTCASPAFLTLTALNAALLAMVLAAAIGHGILRPLLEARGITTWTLKDTLGAMPLVLIGAGAVAGSAAVLLSMAATSCPLGVPGVAAASLVVALGALMVRLGLHALRKLR